jgi:predicted PurR-regulated permease PerM
MDHAHIRAYFLAILTTLLTVIAVYMLRPFLVTIGLAAVFAVVFTPLHKRLLRMRLPASIAALLTLIIGTVCVLVPTTYLGIQLFREAENVYSVISQPGSITQAQAALVSLGGHLEPSIPGAQAYFQSLSMNLGAFARQGLSWGLSHAGILFSGTLAFLLQLFVFMMTLYYLLKEGSRLKGAIERFSPLSSTETAELITRLIRTINSVVRGTFVIALIQGALTAVGFTIFGIPNGVLWGTVAVIGALIPSVGTALVFIPAFLYLLFVGHTGAAIGLAIYGLCGVGIVDNFLRPYLVGGRASIHPLLVLFAVLGGLALFGPGGLFLGPLVFSLLLGLLSIYTPSSRSSA